MTARTGTLETVRNAAGKVYYPCKVRLADGTRMRVEIPEKMRRSATASRDYASFAQEDEDRTHDILNARKRGAAELEAATAGAAGELTKAWHARFQEHRRSLVGSVDDDGWRWDKWIGRRLDEIPIRLVTADDVENVRDDLDAAVVAYETAVT